MKLIIEIPEKVVTAIQNGEDYRYDIHTTIAQGIPYEERPQGDLISREALKKAFEGIFYNDVYDQEITERLIDNAPTVDINRMMQRAFASGVMVNTRPKGEWIKLEDSPYEVECPFCHTVHCCIPKFCTECGADMRKGGEP